VYKQILINAKLKTGKGGKKHTAAWKKSIKETKGCIGLYCHLRRRKRRNNLL
jgi:hypothetical protein